MPDPSEPQEGVETTEYFITLLPPKTRSRARAILDDGGDKSVQLLTRVVAKERAKRRTRARALALPGALLLIGSLTAAVRSGTFTEVTAALGLSGLPLLALSLWAWLPTRLEKAALELLLRSEETRSIGPALEALPLRSPALKAQAKENLIELLPQMSAETFQSLTPIQRGHLYGTLDYAQRHIDQGLRLSVLYALEETGDVSCLGVIYLLAKGEAETDAAATVREVARECLVRLFERLDFGPPENLPQHIVSICAQLRAEKTDFQAYAASLFALRRLLPQLTPSNYKSILSASHRSRLYRLLSLYRSTGSVHLRYGRRELQLAIIRMAERVGDTQAVDALQSFSCSTMAASDEEIYAAVCKALSTLGD